MVYLSIHMIDLKTEYLRVEKQNFRSHTTKNTEFQIYFHVNTSILNICK